MDKIKFGIGQLRKPTPDGAKMFFKITSILTTVVFFIIANTTLLSNNAKVELAVWLKGIDMLVLLVSQMFAIDIKPPSPKGEFQNFKSNTNSRV